MTKEKMEKLADLLVEANNNVGYKEYWAHGEPHSYKKDLSKKEITAIIKSVLEPQRQREKDNNDTKAKT